MTAFTYYPNIPNAPDNPSFDQPLMQVNSQSINSMIGVDHVTFNSTGSGGPGSSGGQHLQVTFNGKNVPGAVTDPLSVMYTNSGSASTNAEVFFRNNFAILLMSCIKAFGYFAADGTLLNGWNMTNATPVGNTYQLNITTNAVTGFNYSVIAISNSGGMSGPNPIPLVPGSSIDTMTGIATVAFYVPLASGKSAQKTIFSVVILQY